MVGIQALSAGQLQALQHAETASAALTSRCIYSRRHPAVLWVLQLLCTVSGCRHTAIVKKLVVGVHL